MSKGKALIIDLMVAVLLALFVWITHEWVFRTFNTIAMIFAGYGYFRFVVDFYHWLVKPERPLIDEAQSMGEDF